VTAGEPPSEAKEFVREFFEKRSTAEIGVKIALLLDAYAARRVEQAVAQERERDAEHRALIAEAARLIRTSQNLGGTGKSLDELRAIESGRPKAVTDEPEQLYDWPEAEMVPRLRAVIEGQGLSMGAMMRELAEVPKKIAEAERRGRIAMREEAAHLIGNMAKAASKDGNIAMKKEAEFYAIEIRALPDTPPLTTPPGQTE
jgi:hypothetical protein